MNKYSKYNRVVNSNYCIRNPRETVCDTIEYKAAI